MFSWFSSAPHETAPAAYDVVPCSALDTAGGVTVLTTGLLVDAKLDAQLLKDTLFKLLEHKFPRAGARLARRDWALEFYIPRSRNRPGIPGLANVSHSEPSTCLFPSLDVYLKSKTCPRHTSDIVDRNMPIVLFDACGLHTLLSAWTRLLAGEDLEAIQGMARDFTPFDAFRGPPAHDGGYVPGYTVVVEGLLGIPEEFSWAHRIAHWLLNEVNTLIRVPKAFLEQRRLEIIHDLKLDGIMDRASSRTHSMFSSRGGLSTIIVNARATIPRRCSFTYP
ncbi:hypothetical protein FB45DRAFT_1028555 [Roridomyces roridus]|uniref:Uncharacterized protein n=1 Tax=Roridomyces roridus TaxID=1738132 RepID=A0AAD7BR39_9AGAR|nr:hypothetical protein FB45DRAFT_1028555 [Roridomyces roridus]